MALFNADEILAIATTIERNGQTFYRKAAQKAADPKAKELFVKLADWESRHEAKFSKMREKLSGADFLPIDPDGSVAIFLNAVADGKVFNLDAVDSDLERTTSDVRSAFNEAVNREQIAVTYFSAIRDIVPEAFGKNVIDDIVREELSHIVYLKDMMRTLKLGG